MSINRKANPHVKKTDTKKLVLSAMLIAVGYVLPFLTGQIKEIGNMLLPMHIPVMLSGLLLGPCYGAAVGAMLPVTRSLIFGMPAMYPSAVAMSFELAAYGAVTGLVMLLFRNKNSLAAIYISLITAMLAGRALWGGVMTVLLGQSGKAFTLAAFTASAFVNAIPGIIVQLVIIPPLVYTCKRVFRSL